MRGLRSGRVLGSALPLATLCFGLRVTPRRRVHQGITVLDSSLDHVLTFPTGLTTFRPGLLAG